MLEASHSFLCGPRRWIRVRLRGGGDGTDPPVPGGGLRPLPPDPLPSGPLGRSLVSPPFGKLLPPRSCQEGGGYGRLPGGGGGYGRFLGVLSDWVLRPDPLPLGHLSPLRTLWEVIGRGWLRWLEEILSDRSSCFLFPVNCP